MEENKSMGNTGHCGGACGSCSMHGHKSPVWWLVALVVLIIVFSLGYKLGEMNGGSMYGYNSMMGGHGMMRGESGGWGGGRMMQGQGGSWGTSYGADASDTTTGQ